MLFCGKLVGYYMHIDNELEFHVRYRPYARDVDQANGIVLIVLLLNVLVLKIALVEQMNPINISLNF